MIAAAVFLALLGIYALIAADFIKRHGLGGTENLEARDEAGRRLSVIERVQAARRVLVHPCSYGGDPIEYHFHPDFDEDDVLATLADIEAL